MMFQPLFVRSLTDDEKKQLALSARSLNKEEARRAGVVLLSSEGKTASDIARSLGFHPSNVKKWVRKFNEEGLTGIAVRKRGPREGPRPSFTRDQVDRLLDLAATSPAEIGYSFERWTAQKLANAAIKEGIVDKISHVTVQQILKRNPALSVPSSLPVSQNTRSLAVGDDPVDGLIGLGKAAVSESDFERAINCFARALESVTNSEDQEAEIRWMLSQSLEELNRFDEAHEMLQKYDDAHAISLLQAGTRGRVKLRLGCVHDSRKDQAKAIASFNEAKKIFLELQDQHGICEANCALGRSYIGLSEYRIARDHLLSAIPILQHIDDKTLAARVYVQIGTVDYYEGSFRSSKESYLKALELAEGHANRNLIGVILHNLGNSFNDDDPLDRIEAAEYNRRGIALLEETGRKNLSNAYNSLGDNLRLSGEWDEAMDCLKRAIELARSLNEPMFEATGRATMAEILLARGKYAEAEEQARACIGTERWLEASALRILGSVQQATGRTEAGLATLRDALRLSTTTGDLHGLTLAQVCLAEAHYLQGGYDQAREYLELAQGRVKEEKSRSLLISGLIQRLAGQIEAASGRYVAAKQHIAQSISIFTTTQIPYEMALSNYAMGLLLSATGEASAAQNHLAIAKVTLDRLGVEPECLKIDKVLDGLSRGARTNLKSGLRFHSDQNGAGHDETDTGEPRAATRLPGEGGAAERASEDSNASGTSDLLLMQRLIEASASRELLLQELAAIIYDHFPVEFVAILRMEDGCNPEPLVTKGLSLSEVGAALTKVEFSAQKTSTGPDGGFLVHFTPGFDAISAHSKTNPTSLYTRFRSGLDPVIHEARLRALASQVELGLEACALRAAAAASSPVRVEQSMRMVMPGFIVGSPPMFEVVEKIHKIRTSDVTVLITGESGTGKELVARALHAESARARAIFLPFNCTATPRDLIESQLFGHRRGAFTGATANYPGMVRAAEGGTLFLDEIGDVALEIQPKLMRFLQEGEIQPLGETRPAKVDVRVVAATNSDLERAVEEGRFREDLFHRLNIIRIHVPPLRERRQEIPALASFFLDHFASRSGKHRLSLSQDAIDALTSHEWPGNVRQLRNEMERVTAYASEDARISSDDLTPEVVNGSRRASSTSQSPASIPISENNGHHAPVTTNEPEFRGPNPVKLKDAVADLESKLIKYALARNRNNVSRTAAELGLSRRGLRLKLAQLGIDKD
jgi:DNA-binding NtrC family response regulator/tetratricopeptide (TPR) repeat protein